LPDWLPNRIPASANSPVPKSEGPGAPLTKENALKTVATRLSQIDVIILAQLKTSDGNMLRNQIVALLSLAITLSRPSFGQASMQAAELHSWPHVSLNVLVVNKSDEPQAPLDKDAFHILEDGAERPIESVIPGEAPVSLALLIDTSGSTYGNHVATLGVATAVVRALPPGSEVMAVLFADKAYIDLPFTPAEPAPLEFLHWLDSRGATGFYDALVATEDYIAAKAHNAKRALLVLSDGNDNASTLNLQQALHKIQQEPGAPTIYFVDTPEARPKLGEKRHSLRVASLVTSVCGGGVVAPDKHYDGAALGVSVAALIRSQYVLTFAAVAALDEKFRKLEVRVDPANLEARAASGYFPQPH